MTVDASTRGRRNRANGANTERRVATYLRTWWPDACRAVRNTQPDPGDIAGTAPDLWWSVKDCQVERISTWLDEVAVKAPPAVGLLVVRRRGHADPGAWWCWLHLSDLAYLLKRPGHVDCATSPVRMELGDVIDLCQAAGLTPTTRSAP